MEWTNRGANQNQSSNQPASPVSASSPSSSGHSGSHKKSAKLNVGFNGLSVILLFSVTLLIVAVVAFVSFGGNKQTRAEGKFVDTSKFQAIFLNGGQVYFGKILNLNDKYVRVSNIYYLKVDQKVQPNQGTTSSSDVTLVKLGCELHGPSDQMLINREQVVFWENLKSDGQVAKAVDQFVKANPDGQKCETNTTTDTTKKQ